MSSVKDSQDRDMSTTSQHETVLQSGTEVNRRYKVYHLIGRGGYGEVYKGIDQTLGREVAIKVPINNMMKIHNGN